MKTPFPLVRLSFPWVKKKKNRVKTQQGNSKLGKGGKQLVWKSKKNRVWLYGMEGYIHAEKVG